MEKAWYRCERHKVIFDAMSPQEARFATGLGVDHCGSNKTWYIADEQDAAEQIAYWQGRGYRKEKAR